MDLVRNIEARLRACENSSPQGLSPSERGLYAEWRVWRHFVQRGCRLRAHRLQTPFAEVDLLLFHPLPARHLIVEVKSLGPHGWAAVRVRPKQRERLGRARQFLESELSTPVELHLALVSHEGEVEVLNDFLC